MAPPEHHDDGQAVTSADSNGPTGAVETVRHRLSPVIDAWMVVVRAFSWVVARVVAVAMFVVAFVPYSIVMWAVGFDPLDRETDPSAESYWTDVEATNDTPEAFRKLY